MTIYEYYISIMNIDLQHIRLLMHLVKQDMILSRAASVMNISQPSASRKLRELESLFATPLVNRHGKRITGLTPFATRLLDDVKMIDMGLSNIGRLREEYSQATASQLSIATTHSQARYFLPEIIERFSAIWPKVELRIYQEFPAQIIDRLLDDKADIAICTEALAPKSRFESEQVYAWQHCICVRKNHELAKKGNAVTFEKIANFPILTYVHGVAGRTELDSEFASRRLNITVAIEAADADVIKTFVRSDLGCGIINAAAIEPERDDDLVFRPIEKAPYFKAVTARKKGGYVSAPARSLKGLISQAAPYFEARLKDRLTPSN